MKDKISDIAFDWARAQERDTEVLADRIIEAVKFEIKAYKAPKAEWQSDKHNGIQNELLEICKNVILDNVFKN